MCCSVFAAPPTEDQVLGAMSIIFWGLTLVSGISCCAESALLPGKAHAKNAFSASQAAHACACNRSSNKICLHAGGNMQVHVHCAFPG